MRFDFFRRSDSEDKAADEAPRIDVKAPVATPRPSDAGEAPGHIVHAMLLDSRKRTVGYRLGWR